MFAIAWIKEREQERFFMCGYFKFFLHFNGWSGVSSGLFKMNLEGVKYLMKNRLFKGVGKHAKSSNRIIFKTNLTGL